MDKSKNTITLLQQSQQNCGNRFIGRDPILCCCDQSSGAYKSKYYRYKSLFWQQSENLIAWLIGEWEKWTWMPNFIDNLINFEKNTLISVIKRIIFIAKKNHRLLWKEPYYRKKSQMSQKCRYYSFENEK
jgi:hypothetical protein